MKLLANENFPYESIHYLRNKGFDISSIGMDCPSIKDNEVMEIAIKEERTILTFDRDYGELIFRHNYKPENGIIYLRIDSYAPIEPGQIVESIILNDTIDFRNALTVVDNHGLRQRKY